MIFVRSKCNKGFWAEWAYKFGNNVSGEIDVYDGFIRQKLNRVFDMWVALDPMPN